MRKIETVSYEPNHLVQLVLRQHEQDNFNKEKLAIVLDQMMAVTIMKDTQPIAILGSMQMAPGFLEVMVLPSMEIQNYPFQFVRTVQKYLEGLIEDTPDFRRMQTFSLADLQTNKWMRILGFICEGMHKNYTPDNSTYCSWARFK